MEITTERLILREFRNDDFDALRVIDSDAAIQRYRGARAITPEMTRNYLERMQEWAAEVPRRYFMLAPTLRSTGAMIGWLPLKIVDVAAAEAEIGWTIAPGYHGQGYATEMARALLEVAFGELQLHRVWAICRTENVASYRVMEKLGMRREAHYVECEYTDDTWRDLYRYAILARESHR